MSVIETLDRVGRVFVATPNGVRFTIVRKFNPFRIKAYGIIPEGKTRVMRSRGYMMLSRAQLEEWCADLRVVD